MNIIDLRLISKVKENITQEDLSKLTCQIMTLHITKGLFNDKFKEVLVVTDEIHFDEDDSKIRNKVFDLIEERKEIPIYQNNHVIVTLQTCYRFGNLNVLKKLDGIYDDFCEFVNFIYCDKENVDLSQEDEKILLKNSKEKEIIYF